METAYRKIAILFLIFGFNISIAQSGNLIFEPYSAKYISENSNNFLICKNIIENENTDSLRINILSNRIAFGDTAIVRTIDSSFTVNIQKELQGYLIDICSEKFKLLLNKVAIFYLPVTKNFNDEINFEISLFANNEKVYSISSQEVNEEGEYILPVIINTYKENPDKTSALHLYGKAEFSFGIHLTEKDTNSIRFWMKSDTLSGFGFALISPQNSDTLANIFTDKFGIFRISGITSENIKSEIFAFPNSWNKVELKITPNSMLLYINEKPSIEKENYLFIDDSAVVRFYSNFSDNNFYIKKIKVINNADDSVKSVNNFNFEDKKNFTATNGYVSSTNTEITKTEFPILISPPQINISISAAYTTLEWFNNSDYEIKSFILQKSLGYGAFSDLYSVENPERGKHYFYDDYNSENKSVIFYRVKQIDKNDEIVYSRQVKVGKAKIKDFEVEQNFPNPFNPSTNIKINVIIPGYFQIGIYDLVGKEIAILHNGTLTEGSYDFSFEPKNLPSGIYLLRVKSLNNTVVRKMIFTK